MSENDIYIYNTTMSSVIMNYLFYQLQAEFH